MVTGSPTETSTQPRRVGGGLFLLQQALPSNTPPQGWLESPHKVSHGVDPLPLAVVAQWRRKRAGIEALAVLPPSGGGGS